MYLRKYNSLSTDCYTIPVKNELSHNEVMFLIKANRLFIVFLFLILSLPAFAQTPGVFGLRILDPFYNPLSGYQAIVWDVKLLSVEGSYVGVEEIAWVGREETPGFYHFTRAKEQDSFFTICYKLTVQTPETLYKRYLDKKPVSEPPFEAPNPLVIDTDKKISLMESEWWARVIEEKSMVKVLGLDIYGFVRYDVASNRENVAIYVDGRYAGNAPLNLILPGGAVCRIQAVWETERQEWQLEVPFVSGAFVESSITITF